MSFIKENISKNPLGIVLVIIHWVIAVIALLNMQVDKFDQIRPSAIIAFLVLGTLFVLDLPAIIPLLILFLPVKLISDLYVPLVLIGSLFTISYEWLFIGRKVYGFFQKDDHKIISLKI